MEDISNFVVLSDAAMTTWGSVILSGLIFKVLKWLLGAVTAH